jgi:alpha-tubulin suppressor-like RCC1 family protein
MTTPNQLNGNFSQIAQSDTDGNVTGIQVAEPENIAITSATATNNDFLQSDGAGALQWAKPIMSYGTIKKMTRSGINGMFTLMEDGRLYLTHATNGSYANSYETAGAFGAMNINSWYGIEATHEITYPQDETGKIIDCDTYGTAAYILYDTGNLYTWGYNPFGQLGQGDLTNRNRPALASTNVVQVFTSHTQSARVDDYTRLFIKKTDGKIYGCGYNGRGALGIGTTTNATSFVEITGAGVNPKSVWNLGSFTGCLVVQRVDGTVLVAGFNGFGNLGNGTGTDINILTAVPAWNNNDNTLVLEQATGGFGYADTQNYNNTTLVMWFKGATTDLVKTCGDNTWGQIGNGNTTIQSIPVTPTIPGTGRITSLFANGGAPLAIRILKSNNSLYGWGYNNPGQLGINNFVNVNTPSLLETNVTELINIGDTYLWSYRTWTMIKKTDGFYYSSGQNDQAQLGNGGQLGRSAFGRMAYPKGMDIKHFGGYTPDSSCAVYFAVDQDGRWWAHGWTERFAITNQPWAAENRVTVPMRVTPFNIVLNQFI